MKLDRKDELKVINKEINNQSIEPLEEKLYWLQIGITVIIGIASYYLFEAGFIEVIFGSDPVQMWSLRLFIILILHLVVIVTIPFIVLHLKTQKSLSYCFRTPFKHYGTNITIILLVFGLTYMLNI